MDVLEIDGEGITYIKKWTISLGGRILQIDIPKAFDNKGQRAI
jgi:hypothetical protein